MSTTTVNIRPEYKQEPPKMGEEGDWMEYDVMTIQWIMAWSDIMHINRQYPYVFQKYTKKVKDKDVEITEHIHLEEDADPDDQEYYADENDKEVQAAMRGIPREEWRRPIYKDEAEMKAWIRRDNQLKSIIMASIPSSARSLFDVNEYPTARQYWNVLKQHYSPAFANKYPNLKMEWEAMRWDPATENIQKFVRKMKKI